MRVSVVLPNIDLVADPKEDADVNGANMALWIQLRTYANHPAFSCLELFLSPKDISQAAKVSRFAQALLKPENRGKGRLELHSIYAVGDVWRDALPRILHTDDLWALSRDRLLRDHYSVGPIAHISDTHCLGHFALHRSLNEVSQLEQRAGDTIIACSKAVAESLKESYSIPYEIKSHPRRIDPAGLEPASQEEKTALRVTLNLPSDLTLGLFLGRVTPAMKAELMLLIDALVDRGGGLVIAGVSNMTGYHEALKAYAEAKGVGDRVFIFGRFPPSERAKWYRACDLFLFPADCLNEAFGQTTIEALACGLPVIQSNWDGLKDTLRSGAGTLVDTCSAPAPDRLSSLSSALETSSLFLGLAQATVIDRSEWFKAYDFWLDNANRAIGSKRALDLYKEEFVPDVVEGGYISLLQECLEKAQQGEKLPAHRGQLPISIDYTSALKHYSSRPWSEEIVFNEAPKGSLWRQGGDAPYVYSELEPMLDLGLLAAIQERASMSPVSARTLAASLGDKDTQSGDVRYHAMFLAKQGFLALEFN